MLENRLGVLFDFFPSMCIFSALSVILHPFVLKHCLLIDETLFFRCAFGRLQKIDTRATPLSIFTSLVGPDFFDTIAVQTNLYATQKGAPAAWKPTDAAEVKAYLGVCLRMSIFVYNDASDYWSVRYGLDCVRSIFSRDRFELLTRYLHLVDNTSARPSDAFYKVRWVITRFERCRKYFAAGRYLTVDERLIAFKVCVMSTIFFDLALIMCA